MELITGLVSVFSLNLLGSATVIFPIPGYTSSAVAGALINPILVGVVGGVGSAIGEMSGYGVGYGGRALLGGGGLRRDWFSERSITDRLRVGINTAEAWFYAYPSGLVIWIFAFSPLPFDVAGIISGSVGYDFRKFFLFTVMGKIPRMALIAVFGATIFNVLGF